MTDQQPFPEDDESRSEPPELVELKTLVEQYVQCFGTEPSWWVLGSSDDKARDIRDAIQTGVPMRENIPPGCVA